VRVGNGAYRQLQLDVFGELLNAAFLWHQDELITSDVWALLTDLVDLVAKRWREPDHGIWEIRTQPRHYVHSKLMCWVALDRAVTMACALGFPEPAQRWAVSREEIHAEIMTRGWNEERQAFVQHYDTLSLDAANLLMPVVGFLPGDHPRVRATIKATLRELTRDGMLYRYLNEDGISGDEGIFGICSFWLADALILSGDVDHGERVFRRMLRWANHLGLYSEEIDPQTGDFLGNFPQAFTHIALIHTAQLLADARRGGARHDELSG
jgi:GH15 family glucan-1,4-alpha-glucosidase